MTASKELDPLWERQNKRVQDALEYEDDITEWEQNFLKSLDRQQRQYSKELSEKQLAVLEKIEAKIRGEDSKS